MPKNKKVQRELRKQKRAREAKERYLDSKNAFGIKDETPQIAVSNIINDRKKVM